MFELLDVKWGDPVYGTPSGTINWSADLGGLPTASSATDLDATLQLAFDAWEAVASVDFERVDAGAVISVTYKPIDVTPGSTIAAIASWGPDIGGVLNSLSRGLIEFNSNLTWSEDGAGGVDFFAIALHEVGHIIGLDHVADPAQIMNAVVRADDLGSGDISGAQFIYGTDGAAVPPVGGGSGGGGGGGGLVALLLGLLALVAGVFTGGGGAVAMAAAASRVEDDEDAENALDYLPGLPVEDLDPTQMVSHPVYVDLTDGLSMPMVEHDCQPKDCGCFGHCAHEALDAEDMFELA